MITKIQLQKDAVVLSEDGKKAGSLERVVVNPKTNVITDIVVRTGGLMHNEEKVVSVEWIDETAEDKILLHQDAGELDGCPPLEERRLVGEHGYQSRKSASGYMAPVVGGDGMPIVGSPMTPFANEQIVTQIEQNIPEGTVAMKLGAKVTSADDEYVGNVEAVLAEPLIGQIAFLQVSKGLLVKDINLIPIEQVLRLGEETVHLRVSKESVEESLEAPIAG
jgi:uncharacterized protein YrrD